MSIELLTLLLGILESACCALSSLELRGEFAKVVRKFAVIPFIQQMYAGVVEENPLIAFLLNQISLNLQFGDTQSFDDPETIQRKRESLIFNMQKKLFHLSDGNTSEFCVASISKVQDSKVFFKMLESIDREILVSLTMDLNLVSDVTVIRSFEKQIVKRVLWNAIEDYQFPSKQSSSYPSFEYEHELGNAYRSLGALLSPEKCHGLYEPFSFCSFQEFVYSLFIRERSNGIDALLKEINAGIKSLEPRINNKHDDRDTVFCGWSSDCLPVLSIRSFTSKSTKLDCVTNEIIAEITVDLSMIVSHSHAFTKWEMLCVDDFLFVATVKAQTAIGSVEEPNSTNSGIMLCKILNVYNGFGKALVNRISKTPFPSSLSTESISLLQDLCSADKLSNVRVFRVRFDSAQFPIISSVSDEDDKSPPFSFNVLGLLSKSSHTSMNVQEFLKHSLEHSKFLAHLPCWTWDMLAGNMSDSTNDFEIDIIGIENTAFAMNKEIIPVPKSLLNFKPTVIGDDLKNHEITVVQSEFMIKLLNTLSLGGALIHCVDSPFLLKIVDVNEDRCEYPFQYLLRSVVSCTRNGLRIVKGTTPHGLYQAALNVIQILHNFHQNNGAGDRILLLCSNPLLLSLFLNRLVEENEFLQSRVVFLDHYFVQVDESEISAQNDFSPFARVRFIDQLRTSILVRCKEIGDTIKNTTTTPLIQAVAESAGNSCEVALSFLSKFLLPQCESFLKYLDLDSRLESLMEKIPFRSLLESYNLDSVRSVEDLRSVFLAFKTDLECLQITLQDISIFEQLRNSINRSEFFYLKHAKIVAMTTECLHRNRKYLSRKGFCFTDLIVLDANQFSEADIFSAITLPRNLSNLKRVNLFFDETDPSNETLVPFPPKD